jgi:ABC-2 type transport system ATP-binding protein
VDPAPTGRALLLFHGRLLGLSRRDCTARADELLDVVDLAAAADRRLRTDSGGMRRRLDLALAVRPDVLFLDEPTTGLDPWPRQALWAEVRRLRAEGTTILLTTQYLEEADQLADRVGILAEGRLRVEGPPELLKRDLGGDRVALEMDPADTAAAAAAIGASSERRGHLSLRVDAGGSALPGLLASLPGTTSRSARCRSVLARGVRRSAHQRHQDRDGGLPEGRRHLTVLVDQVQQLSHLIALRKHRQLRDSAQ